MNRSFVLGAVLGAALCGLGVSAWIACHPTIPPGPIAPSALDPEVAREITQRWVDRGEAAIPEVREALKSDDPALRRCARVALGRITGQWGTDGEGILWKRSLAEAVGRGKPILVLQLFGKFDEEFC